MVRKNQSVKPGLLGIFLCQEHLSLNFMTTLSYSRCSRKPGLGEDKVVKVPQPGNAALGLLKPCLFVPGPLPVT